MHFTRITGKMNEVQWNVDSMSEEAGRSMKVLETKLDAHQANMDTLSQITANQSRTINTLTSDGEVRFRTTRPDREPLNRTISNRTALNRGSGSVCGQHPEIYARTSSNWFEPPNRFREGSSSGFNNTSVNN